MSQEPSRTAAFFDVDGTLLKSTVVEYLVYFQKQLMPRWKWRLWAATVVARAPLFLALDHLSRSLFCRYFYRGYRGLSYEELHRLSSKLFDETIRPRLHRDAINEIRQHREAGRQIVLLTGSLDFIMRPLAHHVAADHLIAASLACHDTRFTGELSEPPLSESEKAEAVFRFVRTHRIDPRNCYAYGDSISDLPMLECVGNPVAVNPDRRLRAIARKRGWRVCEWR